MKKRKIEYIVSLGAGPNQIPLIKAAIGQGYRVIGVDRNIRAPGLDLCDIKIEESLANYRKIVYKLEMSILDGPIVGGLSGSFGEAILSWAYLAEKLKLIGPGRPITEAMFDKYEVRKRFEAIEHPLFAQPLYFSPDNKLKKSQITQIGFPLIVKPRVGHAKSNVFELHKYESAKRFFTMKNLKTLNVVPHDLIIEEKIEGDELTVTGLVQDFKYTLIALTDKVTSQVAPFIELEHVYPSKHREFAGQIREIHQQIVEIIQLADCPVVSEWKVRDGKLYLIEFSMQAPGEFLGPFLIPKAIHYDYYTNLVWLATGKKVASPPPISKTKKARVRFLVDKLTEKDIKVFSKKAPFFKVLNEQPRVPPVSNADRYAVIGEML
ncbi:MAG: ATP-grasp domain-containing protein [Leptospirales bacterium]